MLVSPTRNNIRYVFYRVLPNLGSEEVKHLKRFDKAVLDQGAKVINMSIAGGPTNTGQAYFSRAYAAGTLSVAASGNNGRYMDSYPASYTDVISVAAINENK
jgi:subtilisin family serine protease